MSGHLQNEEKKRRSKDVQPEDGRSQTFSWHAHFNAPLTFEIDSCRPTLSLADRYHANNGNGPMVVRREPNTRRSDGAVPQLSSETPEWAARDKLPASLGTAHGARSRRGEGVPKSVVIRGNFRRFQESGFLRRS